MKKFKVYTAGPIVGYRYDQVTDWRDYVAEKLDDISNGQIKAYSPLRSKEYLSSEGLIQDIYPDTFSVMCTQRGIFHSDRNDVKTADLVFVNMIGATRVSIGTVMEVAWADAWSVPIVYLTEKDAPNLHDHAMIREACPFTVHDMEEAILLTKRILLP